MSAKRIPDVQASEIDWARLAAFIDGEGTIMIQSTVQKKSGHVGLYVDLRVGGCDPRLTTWLQNTFGGKVYMQSRKKYQPNWQDCFSWVVGCSVAVHLLKQCLPYFIMKRDQAEVAIAFSETLSRNVGVKGHPPEVILKRLEMRETLRNLKGRTRREQPNVALDKLEKETRELIQ
jgi:hypothetical protein